MGTDNRKNILKTQISKATKWSICTEIATKMISPITNMILARILAPEIFGVIATVNIVTSFADTLINSGFSKFLIQHEFSNNEERDNNASVAFWTNLIFSLALWIIIIIYSEKIATLLGNPSLGIVIIIASVQIPIASFISIQTAIYRRNFDFKTLFVMRIISALIPVIITIPLAINGLGYWSLIIGTICGLLVNSVFLTLKSEWKPKLYYKVSTLQKMLNYGAWSTIDAIGGWLTIWIDAFLIGTMITSYYLGLYKVSQNLVNSILAIITSAMSPVFFSALSRLQHDENSFNLFFLRMQRIAAFCLFPVGIGIFLYSDFVTSILLGNKWSEATTIIGIWGLVSAFMIVLSNFNSDVFRAKGRPDISVIIQISHMIIVVLACSISINYGFWALVLTRACVRFTDPLISYLFMKQFVGIGYKKVLINIFKPLLCTLIMGAFAMVLKQFSNYFVWNIIYIILCIMIYILSIIILARKDFILVYQLFKGLVKEPN